MTPRCLIAAHRAAKRRAFQSSRPLTANGKSKSALSPWLGQLLKRKPAKLVAVALANKLARIAWKLMVTGQSYVRKSTPTTVAGAA